MYNDVNVIVRCGGCGIQMTWCIEIERQVPDPIRRTACPGRAGSNVVMCSHVSETCFERVQQPVGEVHRRASGGWGQHIRNGGVLIDCR